MRALVCRYVSYVVSTSPHDRSGLCRRSCAARIQATLHKMGQRIIAENPHITSLTYKLPNVHYVPVDMKYIGLDNISPCVTAVPYLSLGRAGLMLSV